MITSVIVPGWEEDGKGRMQRCVGGPESADGPVCCNVNCFRKRGGRPSMFCGVENEQDGMNQFVLHTATAVTSKDPSSITLKNKSHPS